MEKNSLHPSIGWQGWLYWLRHWRCLAARQHIRSETGKLVRRAAGWFSFQSAGPGLPNPPVSTPLPGWAEASLDLAGGDILLEGSGQTLFQLEQLRPRLGGKNAPVIAYQADPVQMAAAASHPVETIWLLEMYGYTIYLAASGGLQERLPGWYSPPAPGCPPAWLLALPPAHPAHLPKRAAQP